MTDSALPTEFAAAPASFAQQGLWYQAELDPGNPAYHVPVVLRMTGTVDTRAISRAVQAIVDRHEVLRTTFVWQDGELLQVIHPRLAIAVPIEDIAGDEETLDARIREHIHEPFDLVRGPLLRFRLLRRPHDAVLVGTMHHLVTDGWSIGLLQKEFAAAYVGEPLPELPLQYADFAEWQQEQAATAWTDQIAYWRERLRPPLPQTEIPPDFARTLGNRYHGATERLRIPAATLDGIRRVSADAGTTLFMTLLAAFKVLIYRHTRQPDVVVGSPIAGRRRAEIEDLVGFFVNMQVLRTDLSGTPSFLELLQRVKETTLGAWDHQDVPFEVLTRALQPARSASAEPFYRVVFALENAARGSLSLPGVTIETLDVATDAAKLGLTFITEESAGGLDVRVEYSSALFTADTARRLGCRYQQLLEDIGRHPETCIDGLALLDADESARLAEWGAAAAQFPIREGLDAWFEDTARRFPDRTAVRCDGTGLTYRELDARADALADRLRKRGVGAESLVGICVERSLNLVVGILGILKAGAAYVPLDPSYPADRLRFMCEDSQLSIVVTHGPHVDTLRGAGATLLRLDEPVPADGDEPKGQPVAVRPRPDRAAYVIYTSGSTGTPKGVIVTHANVMRLMSGTEALYQFNEHDVWTLFHSYAFDFSVWELWGALLYGGTLIVVPHAVSRTPDTFLRLLEDERVTVLNQTPSAFYQLMAVDDGRPLRLRYVVFGGEALDIPRLRAWFDRRGDTLPRLVNMYGITETTVHVTYRPIGAADTARASSVIGRALGDLSLRVLDPSGAAVPIGIAGELYVGGAGVARGYLRRDELTAQRFLDRDGERLYRTGDLVRWLPTGELEYLGRIDAQVKVRGFRIELGEIEHVLLAEDGVQEAVVLLRPDPSGQPRLVAYVVPAPGADPAPSRLRQACQERLPDYMVPAAFVALDALPLTVNGKLDRAVLPDPDYAGRATDDDFVAPRSAVEETLARIWCDVLHLERVGVHDNFFSLGGDSILLLQVAARCGQEGVGVTRRNLVDHQTIAELATLVSKSEPAEAPSEAPVHDGDSYRLTPLQEGLLFHTVSSPGEGVYVEQLHGEVEGDLDVGAFERAWRRAIERHDVFRTSFHWNNGEPRQRVAPDATFGLAVEDWREHTAEEQQRLLDDRLVEDRRLGFNLARPPLMRVAVMRVGEQQWRWLWTHHHLVLDGWCLSQVVGEVLECYRADIESTEPNLIVRRPFRDYIDWLDRQDAQAAEAYWREALAGFRLPSRIDAPKPAGPADDGPAEQDLIIGEELTARLQTFARQMQVTPSTMVTAAWAILVGAYSGSDDVVFGVTVSGRPAELAGFDVMIGPFINTLPLRVRLDAQAPLHIWLRELHRSHARMREHEYSRLVDIQRCSEVPAGTPLFDALMVFENYPVDASLREQRSGLSFGPVTFVERSTYGLALAAIPSKTLTLRLYFDRARFDRATVARMLEQLEYLLDSASAGGVERLGAWSALPPAERALVTAGWNASTPSWNSDRPVHEVFDEYAAANPKAIALAFDGRRLSYGDLARHSDRLSAWLRRKGAGPETLVGLQMDRSIEMVVAIFAVWKAGAAYVPLDPSYPARRLAHMVEDSGVNLVLTAPMVQKVLASRSSARPRSGVNVRPDMLAYVIYTSGSTGIPKGTLVTHRGLANLAHAQSRTFDVRPGDRVLQFASLNFDASVSEIVMALCFGATLHLRSRDQMLPGAPFVERLRDERITHVTLPPSVLSALPHEPLADLRTLIVAGESCPPALAATWADGRRVVNAYGPTENTVCASMGDFGSGPLTIGRPMANVQIYILDRHGELVPAGAAGEVYIGGIGVARGYLRRPGLTAERFVPDPWSTQPGARMYRSGDLARWLADGTIEFLGRIDHQVKIRGHRIEPEEIANVLRERGGVSDAAVIVVPSAGGHPRLVAYVATRGGVVTADALRATCAEWLPDYMVPSVVVVLDTLPLTPSGKLDRAALPDPEVVSQAGFQAPRSDTEHALARVWQEVLGLERVGIDDNFFALGGDSIVTLQIVSKAAQAGVPITARDLFAHPTVAGLARVAGRTATGPGTDVKPGSPIPLSPIQQWFFEQPLRTPDRWNQAVLVEVAAAVDADALEQALRDVGRHHIALRTRFEHRADGWQQVLGDGEGLIVDRIESGDIEDHAERAHASLNLAEGPLARALYFVQTRRLLVVIHHLAVDGVSWRILLDDVQTLLAGGRLLPATPFAAWAQRLSSYAAGQEVDVRYWLESGPPPTMSARQASSSSTDVRVVERRLTAAETDLLLRRVPSVHGTQVNDVLLAAFAASMSTGGGPVWVNLEGHGREPLFDDLDLSRAVGWFTSLFPVRLDVLSTEPRVLLRAISEQLRRLPKHGIDFGVARYLRRDADLLAWPEPEVSFNYLGQLDQRSTDGSIFRLLDGPVGDGESRGEWRRHALDVVASVRSGEFRIGWHYASGAYEAERIESIASAYVGWIRELLDSMRRIAGDDIDDVYALTPLQQGMVFHALQADRADVYVEQLHGELAGAIDPHAFERAWQTVVSRHAIFRTEFVWDGAGEPLQRVRSRVDFRVDHEDWRDAGATDQDRRLSEWLLHDRQRGFALDRPPLLRVALIRLADQRWHWVWTHHHVLLDGWCLAPVVGEVLRCYEAFAAGREPVLPAPRPFRAYIDWLGRQDQARAEAYWRRTLAGFVSPTRIRLVEEANNDERGELEMRLTADETARLQAWTRRHHLTANTLVTGAWGRVLQVFSGGEDVVFGVTVAGRPPDLPGSAEMIGLFINTLPLRVTSGRQATLVDWLHGVQQQQAEQREFEYSRIVDVQRWSELGPGEPLFETLLAFDNYPVDRTLEHQFGSVEVRDVELHERTHYPLTLSVVPAEEMRMRAIWDPARFTGAGVRRMLQALRTLINAATVGESIVVDAWPLVDGDEAAALLARTACAEVQPVTSECLHEWFSRVAARHGDAIAVGDGATSLTYRQLESRSNRLAHYLRRQGVGPETRVGLRMERATDLVTGLLGILKAGGAYVPFDPANPAERTAFMQRDSAVDIIVTEATFGDAAFTSAGDGPVASGATQANAAYVIYTSGSTGRPKGCVVTHSNVVRLMRQTERWFTFDDRDVWTLFHSVAFDFSVWEIWGALLYGGRLVIVPYAVSRSPEEFHDLLVRENITVLNQTPSAFRQLMGADERRAVPLALRYVIFGGEALQIDALAPWFERHGDQSPTIVNMYGITETTVHVTYRVITKADLASGTGSRIGVAIPDLQLYVLDASQQMVPIGVSGELYVGGEGVARGYLGRPALTAERMLPNPFGPGRLYRTGDLVRWREDGLEYLGRADDQVKIRGFRIELGEIESVIAAHPFVRDVAVLVRADRLAAYVVPRAVAGQDTPTASDLRSHAATRLPEYMLPASWVFLDAMPLTSNGKVHRAALPDPKPVVTRDDGGYVAPRSDRERVLADVWRDVLGVPTVGIHDNFFALGGDSIRSIQVLSRARERGVELTFQDLFQHPTIAGLSAGSNNASDDEATEPFSLVLPATRECLPSDVEDAYPLTRLQQGMLFHGESYHDVMSYHLRAPLDHARLTEALGAMAARHPILRASVDLVNHVEPLLLIHREAAIPLDRSIDDWTTIERAREFDLTTAPLMRTHVYEFGDGTFRFDVAFHHAILDGWSLATLLAELFRDYLRRLGRALDPLDDPPAPTFRDFVALERRVAGAPEARAFWAAELEDAEASPLPRLPGRRGSRHVVRHPLAISKETAGRLKRFADATGVPLRSVLLAAHVRALALFTGQDDIVTGLVTNGRPERDGGERVLGLFLNTVPFRLRLKGGTWRDLVLETFRTERRLSPHRRYPLVELQKMRGGVSLFETDFNFVHFHVFDQIREFGDVEVLGAESIEETNFALAVNFSWAGEPARLYGALDYDDGEFTAAQMSAYAAAYGRILETMSAEPETPWSARPLAELGTVAPAVAVPHRLLHELVAPASDAIAVASEDGALTYDELHRRSNRLAHALRDRGVGPDVLVGVALRSSARRVVALLAVLKAGGAYLPIDPEYPPQRLALMLEDSGVAHVIAEPGVPHLTHSIDMDAVSAGWPDSPPSVSIHPENVAYALYTSGSTGKPKGALISHRAIVNHMVWMQAAYPLGRHDRVFQKTPFSFDASVWEFWAPLIAGATVYVARPGGHRDPGYLVETIRAQQLTTIQLVPTLLALLMDEQDIGECRSLRRVFVGGEALTPDLAGRARTVLPQATLVNLYGPTEAAIDSTAHEITDVGEQVPIGRPIDNVRAYVLDRRLQPVPVGTDGDLYIGGAGLGRGYHRRPALTAVSFIADPFSREPGARMYRTGDVARWMPDGTLDFRRRADDQVKVRGHRIELGEVEAAMTAHPSVDCAVAAVVNHRLVGYYTGSPADDLRSVVAARLPAEMMPSAFVHLAAMPQTPSGKIDRRALPAPDAAPVARAMYAAPSSPAESALADVWQSVLGAHAAGVDDNFFDVGGDSILSLQIVARLRGRGWLLAPREVLQHQTIRAIAVRMQRLGALPEATRPTGDVPLSPIQRRFFATSLVNRHHWNQSTLLTVPDDFSFERFASAFQRVAAHHDAFRLRFADSAGEWRQRYDDGPVDAPCDSMVAGNIGEAANRIQSGLNITDGPVMRAAYFADCRRLLIVAHHLVVDAVSWRILLDDLESAYEGRPLPAPTTSWLAWSERLQTYAPSADEWAPLRGRSLPSLPLIREGSNTEGEARQVHVTFDATDLLQTRAADLLLGALGDALRAWMGTEEVWVDVESHGREDLFADVDLSRTVGWFTSIFPVALTAGRVVPPKRGFDYAWLEHDLPPRQVSFNYLGRNDATPGTGFAGAPESAGFDRAPENERQYLIDVTARIEGTRLAVEWSYASACFDDHAIEAVANDFLESLHRRLASGIEDLLPLSPLQGGFLYHALDEHRTGVYLQQLTAELDGVPQPEAFAEAWNRTLARHAALRVAFPHQEGAEPVQVVARSVSCPIDWLDWRQVPEPSWETLLRTDRERGFDLGVAPLMRLTVVRTGERRCRLLWTHHHLILDGWSIPLVLRDVLALYREITEGVPCGLHPAPVYAEAIRLLDRRDRASSETYWREALKGVVQPNEIALPLPTKPEPTGAAFAELERELPEELTAALIELSQRARVTLNTVVQTLWALLVGAYSSQRDVVLGVTVSGRPAEMNGIDEMVGLFINTLPLRIDTGGVEPLPELLRHVQARQAAMSQHESSRLVDVHGWSGVPRSTALFETILVFENYPLGESLSQTPLRDFAVRDMQSVEWTHYPLTCFATPGPRLRLKVVYQTQRFSPAAIQGILDHALELANAMAAGARTVRHAQTPVIGDTAGRGDVRLVVDRFHDRVARTPQKVAVVCGKTSLTYRELDVRAEAVAERLRASGAGRGSVVAVAMERSADLVVALLGVLKSGAAYLPLDLRFPEERLRTMTEDAAPCVTLTSLAFEDSPSRAPSSSVPGAAGADDLAYVIYTSGSTGRPKGVSISHFALANALHSFAQRPGMRDTDVLVAITTISFDISVLEIFLPLLSGATLVVATAEEATDGERLARLIDSARATVLQATPATWRLLLAAQWAPTPGLRMWCGGEAMPVDLAAELTRGGGELWNMYGPTETTIWSAVGRVAHADDARFLGEPIAATSLSIVDDRLDSVPAGVPGELLIGGVGVARGYLGQPAQTAERFVPSPAGVGARAYRTGDRVRLREDGRIEFLGRVDAQVKIRGFRVELGEIEAVLRRDPDVRDAAVSLVDGDRLAAYLVLKGIRRERLATDLASALRQVLPDYMVPFHYADVPALPLTPNGKLDRRALAQLSVPSPDSVYVAPRTPLEEVLADLWRQVLNVDRVGVHDDFFALGGHSLHVGQIVASLRQTFRVTVPLRSVFESATVERLASALVATETTPGRTEQVAAALRRLQAMSPEERAALRAARQAKTQEQTP